MNFKGRIIYFTAIILFLCLTLWSLLFCENTNNIKITQSHPDTSLPKTHTVKISGRVKNEGSYSVNSQDLLYDCIYMAGGLLNSADTSSVDFNEPADGKNVILIYPLDKKAQKVETCVEFSKGSEFQKCNINHADASFLKTLNGVGEKSALKIINYRKTNGEFKTTEELLNIKGIGLKTYLKIKNLITVGGEQK